MNDKENALRIVLFDHPERVLRAVPAYRLTYYGCDHEGFAGGGHGSAVGSRWTDIWGTGWHKEMEGVMGFPREHPLADVGALAGYRWPNPDDERLCGQVYRLTAQQPDGGLFLAGSHRDTLWEKAYMLVGMEQLMVYFHTEPAFVREVLHHIMDFQLGMAQHYLTVGVELVQLGDDLGTQIGPLLGPCIVLEFLVPEYRRLFDLYRQHGVLIEFHSCGQVASLLETFVVLGVDILNPLQATANDLEQVRAVTQGRMALHGGVSSALVMAGPEDRIRAEVRRRIRQLGRDGGYLCDVDQGLPFPPAHVEALNRAVDEWGHYPLTLE